MLACKSDTFGIVNRLAHKDSPWNRLAFNALKLLAILDIKQKVITSLCSLNLSLALIVKKYRSLMLLFFDVDSKKPGDSLTVLVTTLNAADLYYKILKDTGYTSPLLLVNELE